MENENEKVKELRERFAKIQYAASLEKDLQQELDETKDLEKRISLTKRIEEVRETNNEAATTQIIEEAENAQEEAENKIEQNRAKIETLKSRNKELEEKEKAFTKEILENEGIMELKKANPSSKIYISAKEENEKLLKSKKAKLLQIKRNDNKIKKLEAEIESLEDEILDFDDLLSEIRGVKKEEIEQEEVQQQEEKSQEEIQQQEDEMWEQYRLEQEKEEQEKNIRIQGEIDKDFAEKKLEEEKEETRRDLEAKIAGQEWLNDEETVETAAPIEKPKTTPVYTPIFTVKTEAKPVQRTVPITTSNRPVQEQIPKATSAPNKEPEDKGKCEIKEAGFRILANGNPEYYVVFMKDGDLDLKTYDALQYITTIKQKDVNKSKYRDIKNPRKYFDCGLEEILNKFDLEYQTDYADKYIESMKKDAKIEDRGFQLSYNFTNLSLYLPKEAKKLNYLMKIAKANKKAGLAQHYFEPKNIFKRIWKKIENSKFYSKYFLPEPEEYEPIIGKQNDFSNETDSEDRSLQGKTGKEFREGLKATKETQKTIEPDFEDISRTVEEIQQKKDDKTEKDGWEI